LKVRGFLLQLFRPDLFCGLSNKLYCLCSTGLHDLHGTGEHQLNIAAAGIPPAIALFPAGNGVTHASPSSRKAIKEQTASGVTPPVAMQAVWDWEHEHMIEHKSKVESILKVM